jgi:PAS domain S-box-containing protein
MTDSSRETYLQSALDLIPDCFGIYSAVRDAEGRIIDFRVDYVNSAACESNRLSREEQLGRGLCELLPAHGSGLFDAYCRVVETGEPVVYEALDYADHYQGRWLRRAFDIRAARLGDGFAASWRDVTAQKRREHGFKLLEHAGQTLIGSLDYRETVSQVAQLVVPGLADICSVYLRNGQGGLERLAVIFAEPALAELDQALQASVPLRHDQIGVIRDVLESGQAVLIAEVTGAELDETLCNEYHRALLRQIPLSSLIIVPLTAYGEVLGVQLLATVGQGHRYDQADLLLAQELAARAAAAIKSAQMHGRAAEAANLLDTLLQSAPIGFAVLDTESRYLLINERLAELNRLPAAAHLGRRVEEVVPGVAKQYAASVRQVLTTGQPVLSEEFTSPAPGNAGEIRVWEISHYPVRQADGGVRAVGVVVVDVTEQRGALAERSELLAREQIARAEAERAAEHMARLQADLAAVLEAVPAAVWIAHDPDCRLITGNRVASEILRSSQGSNVSVTAPDAPPPHFRVMQNGVEIRPEELPVQRAARGEEVRDFEEEIVFGDGSAVSLLGHATPLRDAQGQLRGAVAAFLDITERKRGEAERARLLEETEQARTRSVQTARHLEQLQNVTAGLAEALSVEQVADVIIGQGLPALRADVGVVALLNEQRTWFANLRVMGYPPEVVAAFPGFAADAPMPIADAVREEAPLIIRTRAERDQRYQALAPFNISEGQGALVALPLLAGGRALGGLGMAFSEERDLSPADLAFLLALAQQCAQALERAQLYEAERRAREQAEAALRMRDVFFSVAAHELKNPLTSLLGQAQLLERRMLGEGQLSERNRHSMDVIVRQATRLNTMIGTLLDTARIERGQLTLERTLLDVGALVRRVGEDIQPTLQQHQVIWDIPERPLLVHGDPLRLEQVLQNLLSNAVKYSPAGGVIELRLGAAGGTASISVSDQGLGIPPAALPHLFKRFYRASNVDPRQISGMGIGLYVVKEIVELHGGSVSVESREGQGSTFTVMLPQAHRAV